MNRIQAQNYTPIPVTGYNHDVFAESFPNAVAVTDTVLDFTNHIMYTQAFAASSGLPAGVPNSGAIADAGNTRQYQLAAYDGPNALTVMRNGTRAFNLVTPASYLKLSLLCFSTENASTINVSLGFTDGSTSSYITNYSLADWFNSNTNVVISGFSRCQRVASPPYNADGLPDNPRFYYVDIKLNCADQKKTVRKVIMSNVTSTGFNAPFPNAVFLAVSGISLVQTISSPLVTPATCSLANGSAGINVTGNTGPFGISWNSTPVQTGNNATQLAAGNYIATITDANNCSTSIPVTVPQQGSSVTVNAIASPSEICSGSSSQLSVSSSGGSLTNYTWTPGNQTASSINVNPIATTTYNVSGQDEFGCSYSKDVVVTVTDPPASPSVNNAEICSGFQANLTIGNPQPGASYSWYLAPSGGSSVGNGSNYQTPSLSSTTTYYVGSTGSTNCVNPVRTPVTVTVDNLPEAPVVTDASICPGTQTTLDIQNPQATNIYNWYTTVTGGSSVFTGASFQTPVVSAATTYYVEAVNSSSCFSNSRTAVTVSLLQHLPAPVVTVSSITSGSIGFSWTAVPNAIGYEVSTDGGLNFQPPSSGVTGLGHVVSGLTPGQNITILVRALGAEDCQNSVLSDAEMAFVPDKNLFVPNVFTPNGDGKNDFLLVFSNSINTMVFRIFNQWGQEIFLSTDPSKGWDGNYKGKPQAVGVYVYVLKVSLTDGTVINKKGSISLLR